MPLSKTRCPAAVALDQEATPLKLCICSATSSDLAVAKASGKAVDLASYSDRRGKAGLKVRDREDAIASTRAACAPQGSINVVVRRVTGIAANGTQSGAAAPFGLGPSDLTDCNFYQPWRCR